MSITPTNCMSCASITAGSVIDEERRKDIWRLQTYSSHWENAQHAHNNPVSGFFNAVGGVLGDMGDALGGIQRSIEQAWLPTPQQFVQEVYGTGPVQPEAGPEQGREL